MRILQVITDTDRRGAQVFASDLGAAMEGRGHLVETVAQIPGANGGLDVDVLGASYLSRSTLEGLRRRARSFDVVIAHGSHTLPASAAALLGVPTPFVYRQISDTRFWAPDLLRRTRVRLGMARARAIVALYRGSGETLSSYLHVPARKIHIVPNGVPTDRFSIVDRRTVEAARDRFSLPVDASVIGYVGALVPEKGVEDAVRAVADLASVHLLVVGGGPERAALERLATELAPDRVTFTGPLADPIDAYAAADAVVLPSRGGDSMPAALIEAGLMGRPAIATPIEGIPDIVVDGRTGLLVPSADVERLRGAMAKLAAEADLRAAMSTEARAHCLERFSIERVAEQWEQVLDVAVR